MTKNANEGNSVKTSADVTVTFTQADAKKVVRKINKLAIKTVEKGCMDIGDLVLTDVFQGSLGEACSKDPFKSNPLVMVCKDPDLMVNRRRLGEWVRAAALRKELIAKKVDCFNLSYSHFAALLQVDDQKKRENLAKTANKEQWPVRKLAKKVGKEKAAAASDGKPENPALDSVQYAKAEELMKAAGDFMALMQDDEVRRLLEDPQELKDRLAFDIRMQLARRIEQFVNRMSDSANLLRLAKRNIAQIELADLEATGVDADVIDVQATVV